MALHRDIFWIGRQWAVTGYGIQIVDQRLRGVFDIEIARLWDLDLVAARRTTPGVNVEDFDLALTVARTRYPHVPQPSESPLVEPPSAGPLVPPVLELRTEGRLAHFLPQWRIRR